MPESENKVKPGRNRNYKVKRILKEKFFKKVFM